MTFTVFGRFFTADSGKGRLEKLVSSFYTIWKIFHEKQVRVDETDWTKWLVAFTLFGRFFTEKRLGLM